MLTIRATAETSASPRAVLDAARDFSERRAVVWPNVKLRYLEVHARGGNFAEVTEGTWIVGRSGNEAATSGRNPERSRKR